MNDKETGGSAFPRDSEEWKNQQDGMTLRDYFAAKALQGLLANPKLRDDIMKSGGCASGWIETSAWSFADEMIKARYAGCLSHLMQS